MTKKTLKKEMHKLEKKVNKIISSNKNVLHNDLSIVSIISPIGQANTVAVNAVMLWYELTGIALGTGQGLRQTQKCTINEINIRLAGELPITSTYGAGGVSQLYWMLLLTRKCPQSTVNLSRYPLLGEVFDTTPAGMTRADIVGQRLNPDVLASKRKDQNYVILKKGTIQMDMVRNPAFTKTIKKKFKEGLEMDFHDQSNQLITSCNQNYVSLLVYSDSTPVASNIPTIDVAWELKYLS